MIPYADTLYFGVLLYPALLVTALGLMARVSWRWVAAINLAMLAIQYGTPVSAGASFRPLAIVAVFAALQCANAFVFLRVRAGGARPAAFRVAVLLALAPLLAVKFVPGASGYVVFLGVSYVTFRCLDVIICINEGGYWKFAVGESRRAGGAAVKRRGAVPLLADRVEELDTWTMSVS